MKDFFLRLFNKDFAIFGAIRSSKWPKMRTEFLKRNPFCAICGQDNKKYLIPHHKKPFHLYPMLELDFSNLVTLCESPGMNCHITFGHLGSFRSFNNNIEEDINIWKQKIHTRP